MNEYRNGNEKDKAGVGSVAQVSNSQLIKEHAYRIVSESLEANLLNDTVLLSRLISEIGAELGVKEVSFKLSGFDVLEFAGKKVDLANQPLMKKLFETFIEAQRGRVTREKLVKAVYGRDLESASVRRKMCDYHNIVKLVSRARKLALNKLDSSHDPKWDWFLFDSITGEWVLCRSRLGTSKSEEAGLS